MDPAVAAAAEEAAMALTMDTVLDWIGFDNVANRERLIAEGFTSFDDMKLHGRQGCPRSRGVVWSVHRY